MNEAILKAQEEVNQARRSHNYEEKYDYATGEMRVIRNLKPRDKGYMPPAESFVTVEWEKGFITVEEKEFKKLPASVRNKILSIGL